jgi:hypothetical protein
MWWQMIDGKLFLWGWHDVEQLISVDMVAQNQEPGGCLLPTGAKFWLRASNVEIEFEVTEVILYEDEPITYRVKRVSWKEPK